MPNHISRGMANVKNLYRGPLNNEENSVDIRAAAKVQLAQVDFEIIRAEDGVSLSPEYGAVSRPR